MVIESLGLGGAQRQLCLLATSLGRMGFSVRVIVFHPHAFHDHVLQQSQIPIVNIRSRSRLRQLVLVRREIRRSQPHVVIGFLYWANLFVELSGLLRRPFSVIASERSLDVAANIRGRIKRAIRYGFHRLADVIVSNSHAQGAIVERIMRRAATRTIVIVNGVDTDYFRPIYKVEHHQEDRLRVLVAARLSREKNALRLIEAVRIAKSLRPTIGIEVNWYGDVKQARASQSQLSTYFRQVKNAIEQHGLADCFHIHHAQRDVRELYLRSDVMCLPSLVEGCSNAIAEAMACGIPVLASRAGDNEQLVNDGRNGFLFDPLSVDDIAHAIVRFSELTPSERQSLGREGRKLAESLLSADMLVARYMTLIAEVADKGRPSQGVAE